ncbi:uncharacterized protein LOC133854902 [Alnus glutinosa]|uniref:uncharacterized protein LOC133854902 n=1 Tax=Alnus glutinosa TaxID=3517 RepID=UPI002D79B1AA|nr:uncharacterized protein LOC133854902 [Alnus glutinosa]
MCSSMADTDADNIKYQKLLSEQNQANPSKFYSQFMYKAVIVIVFLVILPLFPSQAPEFINQSVLTRSWELLHLIFVGIAVSYGLFSRRNDETEKEKENNNSKFDNAHLYVSRFLEVSSVFDDDAEITSGSEENKVQTWSSQYYRNEPMVVVAQEHSVLDEQRISGEKPLLLPVRSLKPRVPEPGIVESANEYESSGSSGSNSRSNSKQSSKRFSSNSNRNRNVELGGLDQVELEEKLMDNVVLPSPIPWRSRSGRMEMKEEADSPPLYTLPPSMEESEFNRVESRSSRSLMSHSSRSNSNTCSPKLSSSLSSPRKSSPSPSLSAESQAKNSEDLVRKKSFYKSSPPPPPPPPPMIRTSSSMRQNSSFRSEPKNMNGSGGEGLMSRVNGLATGKSVRTLRAGEAVAKPTFLEFSEEEKEDFVDTVTMVSDEDTETEDDDTGGDFVPTDFGSFKKEEAASSSVGDGGPDVDKKADEFIAKFREQIRLQRIESIKKSTVQIKRNSSR